GASVRQPGMPSGYGDGPPLAAMLNGLRCAADTAQLHRPFRRLREFVRATWNVTLVTDLGVPRSTARGWLRKGPAIVVSLDATDLRTSQRSARTFGTQGRVVVTSADPLTAWDYRRTFSRTICGAEKNGR